LNPPAKPSGRGCDYGIIMTVPVELPPGLGARLSGYHVVCEPCRRKRRESSMSLESIALNPVVPQVILRWVYRSKRRSADRYLGECETCGTCFRGDSRTPAHLLKRDATSTPTPETP